MDKRPARIQAMFDSIAGSYDLLNHGLSLNRDRAWRKKAVAALGDLGGRRVLDLCAGTADLSIALALAEPAPAQVVGADFACEMLRLGLPKIEREVGERPVAVPLLGADALRMPFADATFDAATVAFGIRNVASLEGGLAEMRRVLRPAGRVAVLEFNRPSNPIFRLLYETYFHVVLPLAGNLVSGSKQAAYGYLPRSVLSFPSPKKLSEIMRAVGFADVRYRSLDLGIVTLHTGVRR